MYDNYTELIADGLTRGVTLRDAYILVLREPSRNAIFPVLISETDFHTLKDAMTKGDFTASRLMTALARKMEIIVLGVRLLPPQSGRTQALIDFERYGELLTLETDIAAAVVAAMENHVSIWIKDEQFSRQTQMPHDEGAMALPIGGMNDMLLTDVMQAAVEQDNFELAQMIRDELTHRQRNNDTTAEAH